ncbi:hypothetical protein Dimus_022226, partial [Dionaea muscipula]
ALPIDLIWRKRVIRCKIVRENWMMENGLRNVMEVIQRQEWEKLFKRRELVHVNAVKEFYVKLTMSHNRKKDVAKSKKCGKNQNIPSLLRLPEDLQKIIQSMEARRVKSVEMKPFQSSRRRTEEEEKDQTEFDWEAVVDEAAVEGESRLGEKFYDAEDEVQGSPEVNDEIPAVVTQASAQQKEPGSSRVDPSGPSGHLPEAVMNKLQAEFERARANRFQADLEKAQAENARLLALL